MRIGAEQMQLLIRAGESLIKSCFPLWVAAAEPSTGQIDTDDFGIRVCGPAKEEQGAAVCRPDLKDALWFSHDEQIEKLPYFRQILVWADCSTDAIERGFHRRIHGGAGSGFAGFDYGS